MSVAVCVVGPCVLVCTCVCSLFCSPSCASIVRLKMMVRMTPAEKSLLKAYKRQAKLMVRAEEVEGGDYIYIYIYILSPFF